MKKESQKILLLTIGLFLASIAIFAQRLGLDHNDDWGRGCILLLILSGCLFLSSLLFSRLERLLLVIKTKIFSFLHQDHVRNWSDNRQLVGSGMVLVKTFWFVSPVVGLVLVVYVWFISLGLWTTWPARTEYYSLLAGAFLKQELFLPVEPSEKLLALSDPYDPAQRIGVGEPMDFSLYDGKFYLYWGPVPALILAMVNLLFQKSLSDLYLVFGFLFGLFLLQSGLILALFNRYFGDLPKWILIMSILLTGLSVSTIWMLGHASIYDAAIAGGQFFLMAGFIAALLALNNPFSPGLRLPIAGSLWALAIGTRFSLLLPIGFMMIMVVYRFWRAGVVGYSQIIQRALFLGLPMLCGLALLSWYNWTRFGSMSETGFSYALAGTNIQKHLDLIISYKYIIQNFYNYFLVPFHIHGQFPYIFSNDGSIRSIFPFYELPGFYNTNPITGLIYSTPFLFFYFATEIIDMELENSRLWIMTKGLNSHGLPIL